MVSEDLARQLECMRADLVRFARSRVGPDDAEDAVQTALQRLLPYLDRYRHPRYHTLSYAAVYTTLRRVCVEMSVDEADERTHYSLLSTYTPPEPSQRLEMGRERLRYIVARVILTDYERECILALLDGESAACIAERLRVSEPSVCHAIASARNKIGSLGAAFTLP